MIAFGIVTGVILVVMIALGVLLWAIIAADLVEGQDDHEAQR